MIGYGGMKGLGAYGDVKYGSIVDLGILGSMNCADSMNAGDYFCRAHTLAEWQQLQAAAIPVPPAPLPPAAPQTQQDMTQGGAWTPDIAIQQTAAAQKNQMSNFFAGVAATMPATTTDGVDCTSFWTYLTDPTCPADCTRFPTALINSTCGGSSWLLPIGGAIVALVLVKWIVR